MREGEAARAGAPSVSRRGKSSAKSNAPFVERRRVPRPKFAEIRRGASLNLLPPSVVAGSVRIIEFLLVAVLGFAIYRHAAIDLPSADTCPLAPSVF